jgi:hypothetical protein
MRESDLPWRYRQIQGLERAAFRIIVELLALFWLCVIAVARWLS